MNQERAAELLRIARLAIDAAARECGWPWTENLSRLSKQAGEVQDGLRETKPKSAWERRPGTVREIMARLSEMPDFPVYVWVNADVACPKCAAVWDGYDLDLTACSVKDVGDIERIVPKDLDEYVQIMVTP